MNTWVRGAPSLCVVDDLVPGSSSPRFAKSGSDGSLWMSLLEKCYAKASGNYEYIGNGGWMDEGYDFLTGAPTRMYSSSSLSATALVTLFKSIEAAKFLSTVAIIKANTYRLPPGHAYSFITVCDITKKDNSVQTLFSIRNPWGSESYGGLFNGTVSDSNTAYWATVGAAGKTYAQQCTQTNANDGLFYVTVAEYIEIFYPYISVGEWLSK